jgi:phosphonopyruvate decarboxylase
MIDAEDFIQEGLKRDFNFYTGVPCSYLKPFINYVIDSPSIDYIAAANEGDAIAIGAGASLAGKNSIVMFQNSGLGNAVNPITSLNQIFKVPSLIITTLRGDPEGPSDEPQHKLMGEITTKMLDLMKVNWEFFPSEKKNISIAFSNALKEMNKGRPYALVMKKGKVNSHQLNSKPKKNYLKKNNNVFSRKKIGSRNEVIKVIQKNSLKKDLIIATTGYTGRELFASEDRKNQFYTVGSMGCASSLSLGVALGAKRNRVITLDGDGALLMRMGALATIGYYRPKNFLHILLNNELHESTGGQSTVSHSIDFCDLASSCGYEKVISIESLEHLSEIIKKDEKKLTFCLINIDSGVIDNLPRPDILPEDIAKRFIKHIKKYNNK